LTHKIGLIDIICILFFTEYKAEINYFSYSLACHMRNYTYMTTRDVAKVKNSNNDDIFQFFLEYHQANEQRDEQE
jgi:hypothetical protein